MDVNIFVQAETKRGKQYLVGAMLGFFLWFNIHPAAAAITEIVQHSEESSNRVNFGSSDEETLDLLKQLLSKISQNGASIVSSRSSIANVYLRLEKDANSASEAFRADAEHIESQGLSETVRQRHRETAERYEAKIRDVLKRVKELENLPSQKASSAASSLLKDLRASQLARKRALKPENLPFRTVDTRGRLPKLSEKELRDELNPNVRKKHDRSLDSIQRRRPATRLELSQLGSGFSLTDYLVAQTGEIEVAGLGAKSLIAVAAVAPPGPEFLAPTEDVQLTSAVREKAAALHNSPIEIYNWVRNNIEFVPSYGSIRGSEATLETLKGNAFDTASLLIALLRAAGVPARYAYGTVQIPSEKVMNWVGGMKDADAAQTLMASGGIPNGALTHGGKTVAIDFEHVWVEAFVDFFPGRGTKSGVPDTWVPLDASFKQFNFSEGLNIKQNVPFDAQVLLSAATQGATVNQAEAWGQNFNGNAARAVLDQYQQQVSTYIDTQTSSPTVAGVVGGKIVKVEARDVLSIGLPYRVVARGGSYSALPDLLQHKFRYRLYQDEHQRALENYLFEYEVETVKLVGKRLILSYAPSTQADMDALESYVPKANADGSAIQPSEIPSQIPAYGIYVTPRLMIDGVVVASGGSFSMGTSLLGEGGFTSMGLDDWDVSEDDHIAGRNGALGISLQGIVPSQVQAIAARITDTKSKLQAHDHATLTAEHLGGDLLTSGLWSYFAAVETFGRESQRLVEIIDIPGLSYGFFYADLLPVTRYGMVTAVRFPGVRMDIGHQRRIAFSKTGDKASWVGYNKLRGQQSSALEHAIPERLFRNLVPGQVIEGMSTVKALSVAAAQGQKIYTLTKADLAQVANISQSTGVKENIREALNAGKEVTVHQSPINYAGFSGAGYIVTDPATGAGAYLIEGGANGGELRQPIIDFLVSIGLLAKDVALALLENAALSIIDLLFSIYSNASALGQACGLVLKVGFTVLNGTLAAAALAAGALFPLVYGFVLGLLVAYALDQLLESELEYCNTAANHRMTPIEPRRRYVYA